MSVIRPFSLQSSLFFRWFIDGTFRTRKKRILLGRETRVVVEKREEEEEDRGRECNMNWSHGRETMKEAMKEGKKYHWVNVQNTFYFCVLCFGACPFPFPFPRLLIGYRVSCRSDERWARKFIWNHQGITSCTLQTFEGELRLQNPKLASTVKDTWCKTETSLLWILLKRK